MFHAVHRCPAVEYPSGKRAPLGGNVFFLHVYGTHPVVEYEQGGVHGVAPFGRNILDGIGHPVLSRGEKQIILGKSQSFYIICYF